MLLQADFPYWWMPYREVPLYNDTDDKIVTFKNFNGYIKLCILRH